MPAKKKTRQTPKDFEQSMNELEDIVKAMESGELSLEESLQHFERGIGHVRNCQKALDEAEQRVKLLVEDMGDGQLQDFDQD